MELVPVESYLGTRLSHAGTEVKLDLGQAQPCSPEPEGPQTFAPFSPQQLHVRFLGGQDVLPWPLD